MSSHLPTPPALTSDNWSWQDNGLCKEMGSELFFHPEGERGGTRRRRTEAAKAICNQCPVIKQCREYSFVSQEPYGVWGGISEEERRELLNNPHLLRTA